MDNLDTLLTNLQLSIWEFANIFHQLQLKNLGFFKAITRIKAHQGIVRRIVFCRLGPKKNPQTYLISCGVDKIIKIWDMQTFSLFKTLEGHKNNVYKLLIVRFQNKPYLLSSSSDKTIIMWSLRSFRIVKTLIGHSSPPYALHYIDKKRLLVSGDWDGNLIIWSLKLGKMIYSAKTSLSQIWSIYYEEKLDSLILGAKSSDKIWFFDLKKRFLAHDIRIPDFTKPNFVKFMFEIGSIQIHPDINEFLVCSGSNNVALINRDYSLNQISLLQGHTNHVRSFVYSKKRNLLITAGCDRKVRVWRMEFDRKEYKVVVKEEESLESGHTDNINCVAIDEEENLLATCSWDGEIFVYSSGERK